MRSATAVFFVFGFVSAQSQGFSNLLLHRSLAKNQKILAAHRHIFSVNALKRLLFGEKLSRNIARKTDFKLAFLMPDRKIAPPVYMESDLTESALFYKLWAWGDKNRKQLLYGLIAIVVGGIIVAFWLAHAHEKQKDANSALVALTSRNVGISGASASPEALLKVNSDYPDTDAGQRALLLAAGDLFAAGKYDEAMTQFNKFLKDYNNSPLAAQAALGVAACYDATGKTNDAATGYQGVIDRYPTQNVVAQARLRLGVLLEAQGKFRDARNTLEDLARNFSGTMIGSEGIERLQELNAAHPEAQPAPSAAMMTPKIPTLTAPPAMSAPKTSAPAISIVPSTNKAP
jgi:predicted negative regulator of RcsB-dependent stress response